MNKAAQALGRRTDKNTTTDAFKSTFHRDGTVTYWNVYEQRWNRASASRISDESLASMSAADRKRTLRMARK